MSNISQNLFYSLVGTSIAEIATLPLCTIKTNYQNNMNNSIKTVSKDIYNKYGIRGFYKASFPALGSQLLSSSTKYVFYHVLEDQKFQYSNKFLNGCISGITNGLAGGDNMSAFTLPGGAEYTSNALGLRMRSRMFSSAAAVWSVGRR